MTTTTKKKSQPKLELEDFDITKRAATQVVEDPKTGKDVVMPLACFGWHFNPNPGPPPAIQCAKECPHAKACAALSKHSAKAQAELEDEAEADAEAEAVTKEDVKLAKAGMAKRAEKKKPKTSSKGEELTKGEPRKNELSEESYLKVAYDLDYALGIEDEQLRKFHKRIVKVHGEGGRVKVATVINVLIEVLELDEGDREECLTGFIPDLLAEGNFERA